MACCWKYKGHAALNTQYVPFYSSLHAGLLRHRACLPQGILQGHCPVQGIGEHEYISLSLLHISTMQCKANPHVSFTRPVSQTPLAMFVKSLLVIKNLSGERWLADWQGKRKWSILNYHLCIIGPKRP